MTWPAGPGPLIALDVDRRGCRASHVQLIIMGNRIRKGTSMHDAILSGPAKNYLRLGPGAPLKDRHVAIPDMTCRGQRDAGAKAEILGEWKVDYGWGPGPRPGLSPPPCFVHNPSRLHLILDPGPGPHTDARERPRKQSVGSSLVRVARQRWAGNMTGKLGFLPMPPTCR